MSNSTNNLTIKKIDSYSNSENGDLVYNANQILNDKSNIINTDYSDKDSVKNIETTNNSIVNNLEIEGNKILAKKLFGKLLANTRKIKENALYASLSNISNYNIIKNEYNLNFGSVSFYDEVIKPSNKKLIEDYILNECDFLKVKINLDEKKENNISPLEILKKEFGNLLVIKK